MLSLLFCDCKDTILSVDRYFDNWFDETYLDDDYAKRIVSEVDKCEVISPYNIISPVLGSISYTLLSGGCKALLMLKYMDDVKIDFSYLGGNCYQLLVDIAKEKDICIYSSEPVPLLRLTDLKELYLVNQSRVITDNAECFDAYLEFAHKTKYNNR